MGRRDSKELAILVFVIIEMVKDVAAILQVSSTRLIDSSKQMLTTPRLTLNCTGSDNTSILALFILEVEACSNSSYLSVLMDDLNCKASYMNTTKIVSTAIRVTPAVMLSVLRRAAFSPIVVSLSLAVAIRLRLKPKLYFPKRTRPEYP